MTRRQTSRMSANGRSRSGVKQRDEADSAAPATELRRRYERTRALDLGAQTREVVDYISNPEILVGEFVDSFCSVENLSPLHSPAEGMSLKPQEGEPDELTLEYFYPSLEVVVHGGDASDFVCLASQVAPLDATRVALDGSQSVLDYIGLAAEARPGPRPPRPVGVLGAVQSPEESAAYPILLRLLSCLSELAAAARLRRMDEQVFAGRLGAEPLVDLHLVLWDLEEVDQTPVNQLTHDLAEVFLVRLADEMLFPGLLRRIVCLRMDPDDFDGDLHFEWGVSNPSLGD